MLYDSFFSRLMNHKHKTSDLAAGNYVEIANEKDVSYNNNTGFSRLFNRILDRYVFRNSTTTKTSVICTDVNRNNEDSGIIFDPYSSSNPIQSMILIEDDVNVEIADVFSIEFVIKLGLEGSFDRLFFKGNGSYSIYYDKSAGQCLLRLQKHEVGTIDLLYLKEYIDEIIHVVYTRDSTGRFCSYVNGNLINDVVGAMMFGNTINGLMIGNQMGNSSYNHTIYLFRLYNYALSNAEVIKLFNNSLAIDSIVPFYLSNASNNNISAITRLIIGKKYYLKTYVAGDDFTNCGGQNVSGSYFIATFDIPAVFTTSELIQVGNIFELKVSNVNKYYSLDSSGNGNHGILQGKVRLTSPQSIIYASVKKFLTNIASGVANKDITIEEGYYPIEIQFRNHNNINLTSCSCIYNPASDNINVFSAVTIKANSCYSHFVNTNLPFAPVNSNSSIMRFNASGNTLGLEITVVCRKKL